MLFTITPLRLLENVNKSNLRDSNGFEWENLFSYTIGVKISNFVAKHKNDIKLTVYHRC